MYQMDAFSRRTFGGNPAAICVLGEWLAEIELAGHPTLAAACVVFHYLQPGRTD